MSNNKEFDKIIEYNNEMKEYNIYKYFNNLNTL